MLAISAGAFSGPAMASSALARLKRRVPQLLMPAGAGAYLRTESPRMLLPPSSSKPSQSCPGFLGSLSASSPTRFGAAVANSGQTHRQFPAGVRMAPNVAISPKMQKPAASDSCIPRQLAVPSLRAPTPPPRHTATPLRAKEGTRRAPLRFSVRSSRMFLPCSASASSSTSSSSCAPRDGLAPLSSSSPVSRSLRTTLPLECSSRTASPGAEEAAGSSLDEPATSALGVIAAGSGRWTQTLAGLRLALEVMAPRGTLPRCNPIAEGALSAARSPAPLSQSATSVINTA
mmetsp:Transcript_23557/g.65514  ORF Transcript_23557/g.65514 Transcript_23557/m.65514 type:complete len:288 (+) Transcript_23557:297-1160(+)